MGGGTYSVVNATNSRAAKGVYTKSVSENFTQSNISPEMDPHGLIKRESRDSEEHPNSLAIILGIDVTGSMGSVPQYLVRDGLPMLMSKIIMLPEPDAQLLFLGIGDHECDQAPLQVGQFESNDQMLDHWLEKTWIERGGGGNDGESYLLAWYFAGDYTDIDCFTKRGRKGILITVGDEPCLESLPAVDQQAIMGTGQYSDRSAAELLKRAQARYEVYHIHVNHGYDRFIGNLDKLLGDHLIIAQTPESISEIIVDIVSGHPKAIEGSGVAVHPTANDAAPAADSKDAPLVL